MHNFQIEEEHLEISLLFSEKSKLSQGRSKPCVNVNFLPYLFYYIKSQLTSSENSSLNNFEL